MTSFVNDEGEYLDYSGSDIGTTKQCANFYDFKIKGDVTATLKIPNNSQNRKALGYYGANQINSPAFSRSPFSMVKDGNTISRGYVVIKDSDEDSINIFYVSGNTNWFQAFQFNIKDCDYTNYTVLMSDVNARKSSTDGIVFPLVDWAYNGNKLGYDFVATGYQLDNFSINPTKGDYIQEFFPCIYLHSVVRSIAEYSGFKISGSLLSDALFKRILITPDGPNLEVPDSIIGEYKTNVGVTSFTASPVSAGATAKITWGRAIEPSRYFDFPNSQFVAPIKGTYKINIGLTVNGGAQQFGWQIFKNGVAFVSSPTATCTSQVTLLSGDVPINLNAGDTIDLRIWNCSVGTTGYTLTQSSFWRVELWKEILAYLPAPGTPEQSSTVPYVLGNCIVPGIKAIDFLKWIAVYFGCVVRFDEYSNTVEIDTIASLQKENADDWSEYYVNHTEIYSSSIAKNNYIETADVPDEEINAYNSQSLVKFGGGNIETGYDVIEDKVLYKLPFSGSWDSPNKTKLGGFLPFIKFYELNEDTGEFFSFSSVANSGGLAQFTGSGSPFVGGELVFVKGLYYYGYAVVREPSTTTSVCTLYGVAYTRTDSGIITKVNVSKENAGNRLLLSYPGETVSKIGLPAGGFTFYYHNSPENSAPLSQSVTSTTGVVSWFDKPKMLLPIDSNDESLAIDPILGRTYNNTIGERYLNQLKKAFNNATIRADMLLPLSVFTRFNFDRYIYLETKNLTGYFLVQKIENYKDALTPVRCELLYID